MKKLSLLLTCIFMHGMLSACSGERYTELMNAARDGNNKAVMRAISGGAKVDQRTSQGKTALMLAAAKGHLDTVKLLIENGADVNLEDGYGTSPIIVAATANKYQVIEELIKHGANPSKRDSSGGSALDNAVFYGHKESVKALLQGTEKIEADQAAELLLMSAGLGHKEIVESLVNFGVDVNSRGKKQRTALIAATRFDRLKVVEYLLQHGADLSLRDADGNSALDIAKQRQQTDMIALFQRAPTATTPPQTPADSPSDTTQAPQ